MSVLTSANYQDLARLLPHISAEVLARRFVAQRYSDFKVSELRTILQFLKDKTDGGAENPHWLMRGVQGAKKELLVERVRAGLDWMRKNAGQLRESREMAARQQQAAAEQQQGYRPDQGYQQPPNGAGAAGSGYVGYQSTYPPSGLSQAGFHPPSSSSSSSSSSSAYPYGGQVPYINNYNQQPAPTHSSTYRTERKEQNGYPPPPSSSLPNGYRLSQSAYSAPLYPPPSSDVQLSSLLAHPNFQSQRSPYEMVVQTLASSLLTPTPAHASNARCACPFSLAPDKLVQLRRTRSSGGLYSVAVRLFSAATHSHVAWDKSFRVKVNAHEVAVPEPKKLSKVKKKGVELVRALQLTEWCGATNYLEVEVVRASYLVEMFRGAVVVELVCERATDDIVQLIQARQPALQPTTSSSTSSPAIKHELLSSPPVPPSLNVWKPNPKRCAVCYGTKDLLRCSRCKNLWYCLSAGTRVQLANHTSVTIESIPTTRATSVLSYDPAQGGCVNKLTLAPHLLRQGVKECVELVLEDGRKLVCTADHRLMTTRGEVRVEQLTDADRVLVAPEGPLVGQQPEDWTLTYTLTEYCKADTVVTSRTTDLAGYQRCMAFARLLGYLITDGTIKTCADGVTIADAVLFLGHELDAQSIGLDVALVLDVHPTAITIDPPTAHDCTYRVHLPRRLVRVFIQFGCRAGRKLGQGIGLPPILLQTDTPLDFIREFVAAMFGGDGGAPLLSLNPSTSAACWEPVVFYASVMDDQRVEAARMFEGELLALLGLFGVSGTVSARECKGELSTVGSWQVRLHVDAASTLPFADGIGFRHCVHKQQRLSVAAGYYRGVDRRIDQKRRLVDAAIALHDSTRTWGQCAAAAAAQMATTEVMLSNIVDSTVRNMSRYAAGHAVGNKGRAVYKSVAQYVEDCGASDFFNPGKAVSGSSAHVYAVHRHLTALPSWHLAVEGTRPVGRRTTYDLSVAHTHLFVANGVVVHNCGIEHQRDHWTTHRQQCHQPTEEQEREREAYEKHTGVSSAQSAATVSPSSSAQVVSGVTLASNGRTRLRMPVKQEKKEGADVSVVGEEDSDVEEDELAEVDSIVSLKDLLLQDRIKLAVKGRHCSHLPCFDLSTFLELSQQSGVWQCPICHKGVLWDDVVVDAEMNAVLREVDEECMQIRVKPDGSYEPIDEQSRKKQKTEPAALSSSSSSSRHAGAATTKFTSYIAGPTSPLSVSPLSTPTSTSDTAIRTYPSTNGHLSHLTTTAASPQPLNLQRSASPATSSSSVYGHHSNDRVDFLDNVDAPQLTDQSLSSSSSSSAFAAFDGDPYHSYARDGGGIDLYGSGQSTGDPFGAAVHPTTTTATSSATTSSHFPTSSPPSTASTSYPLFAHMAPSAAVLSASSAAGRLLPSGSAVVGGATLEDAIVIDDD